MHRREPFVIGIAGGSGSGKTTVIHQIQQQVGKENAVILAHDWYYRDNPHLTSAERSALNYDHPDALETSLLVTHLQALRAGRPIAAPQYDFNTHLRLKTTVPIKPERVIVVDGILILHDEELRDLMHLKLYVDTDADLRFIRRMERDIATRGRSREAVVRQYLTSVKPMHDQFVETSRQYADVIIPHGRPNNVAITLLSAQIKAVLAGKPV